MGRAWLLVVALAALVLCAPGCTPRGNGPAWRQMWIDQVPQNPDLALKTARGESLRVVTSLRD